MFAPKANTMFFRFRSCSNRVEPRQLEPWYMKHPHMSNRINDTFDSLRPINNLSVKHGRVFLGLTGTKLG